MTAPETPTSAEALAPLLKEVAEQFRFYEKSHRDKGTPEGAVKAATNAVWAGRLENEAIALLAALAPADGAVTLTAAQAAEIGAAWRIVASRFGTDVEPFSSMWRALCAANLLESET